ncbi:hypothetical protein [Phenylobacterium sp.]|uniref:hypothetical protein n=1 Tax=Phenylobacterium sp. TaxID=1871053 RepID=UPI002CE149F8|nr:hypothetical protein [Phenylobacterium sp.]HLZ73987.1 hypothetical protein [Phenylobacterium sp.]
MGRSNSWIAIRGLDRSEVARRLGCEETERTAGWGGAELSLGDMGNGWLVVRNIRFDYPTLELMQRLSAGAEALACQVEEHVMVSVARGFHDGAETWSATHNPEHGFTNLAVEGSPPAELAGIRQDLHQKQEAEGEDPEVDWMFDAGPEIVAALSGYRDDHEQGIVFVALEGVRPPKVPGLFQRLFGRK